MLKKLVAWNTQFVRWDAKSNARWERTRARGKSRYVWFTGVLGWGVFMFIVMTVFTYLQQYGPVWPTADDPPVPLVVVNLLIWPLAGYFFGTFMWMTLEATYRSHADQ